MSGAGKRVEEALHLLAQQSVVADGHGPLVELLAGRQLTVEQQIGDLEERALLGQILNGVAAMAQGAFSTIDVGDG